jgi:hypothetical protein
MFLSQGLHANKQILLDRFLTKIQSRDFQPQMHTDNRILSVCICGSLINLALSFEISLFHHFAERKIKAKI